MRAFGVFVGMVILACAAVLIAALSVWFLMPHATDGAWTPGYPQSVSIVALVYVLGSVIRGVSATTK